MNWKIERRASSTLSISIYKCLSVFIKPFENLNKRREDESSFEWAINFWTWNIRGGRKRAKKRNREIICGWNTKSENMSCRRACSLMRSPSSPCWATQASVCQKSLLQPTPNWAFWRLPLFISSFWKVKIENACWENFQLAKKLLESL